MRLSGRIGIDALDELIAGLIMEQAWEVLGDVRGLGIRYSGGSVVLTDGRHDVQIDRTSINLSREFRSAAERLKHRREWTF